MDPHISTGTGGKRWRRVPAFVLVAVLLGCEFLRLFAQSPASGTGSTLTQARQGFHTTLTRQEHDDEAPDPPPPTLFNLVSYEAPVGKLAAYVSVPPADHARHPAIIWVFGGFDNGIGATAWEDAPATNDRSARAFREAGMVMMYPSLRGGNKNPGFKEGFYGEVDDVLAATDYLVKQPFVDPHQIYLGGHSTGGTLVALVAECSPRYRAVFSFGAVSNVAGYGQEDLPFDITNRRELLVRAPSAWLRTAQSRLILMEGTEQPSNIASLRFMEKSPHNDKVEFHEIPGLSHFSDLAPATKMIAQKIATASRTGTDVQLSDADFVDLAGQ